MMSLSQWIGKTVPIAVAVWLSIASKLQQLNRTVQLLQPMGLLWKFRTNVSFCSWLETSEQERGS